MKKLVSLLLVLILSLCALTPAMAETTGILEAPAAFSFSLTDYQTYLNFFYSNGLGITPVWTTVEDGLSTVCDMQDYGKVTVGLSAEGKVTKLGIESALSLDSMQTGAYYFGVSLAMATMAAKAAEDISFLQDQTLSSQLQTDLTTLINSLTSRMSEVLTGETITESGVIADHTATVSLRVDVAAMTFVFGYTYAP